MRLRFVVLLGALFASVSEISLATDLGVPTTGFLARSPATGEHNEPAARLLRAGYTPEKDDEERTFSIKAMPGVEKISSLVNKQQFAWWLRNGEKADDVFTKLKLNKAGDSILNNPKLAAWVKYVDAYNVKHPEKKTSTIPTLAKQYGDDVLATMLQTAKYEEGTRTIASKLQTEQMSIWKREGISTDAVFKTFKLDEEAANLLANPGFSIWTRYLGEFNPGSKTTIFDSLQAHLTETTLSRLLITAKKAPGTERLATSLQNKQLETWLTRGESPNAVFKLLMLDKVPDNVFASPQFKTWLNYATALRRKNPGAETKPVIDTLTAHYTDIGLSRMINAAKETSGTTNMAAYMEKALLGKWATDGKTPAYASNLLWASAADKKSLEAAYLEKLVVQSTKRLAENLQVQQVGAWMARQETPDAVFKLLRLDQGAENIFARPQFDTWLNFALRFRKEHADAEGTTVFVSLMAHYSDTALARMIKTAKETPGTKNLATYMEKDLLGKWATDGKAPAYVLIKLGTTAEDKKLLLSAFMTQVRRAEREAEKLRLLMQ
ncbi:hypothetical protein PHYPSEUDO_008077 [Phytophthora pseudosyringae]|uniref:RxLR effector PexRD54 WY domain-containing protein n=1 Tax=Phytophthora pseudosyringae TaxID=221518 RepID=A0A8T1VHY6_9STRA|nr:hypothetical protein PHYPSEUDO_008077 [Phytophthora pseudosyringae]